MSNRGEFVHSCDVKLENPVVYDESAANSTMEIDRKLLLTQGHDRRIIVYKDGEPGVVALDPRQVRVLD